MQYSRKQRQFNFDSVLDWKGGEVKLKVRCNYIPAFAGTMYKRNGDPGDPPEPSETEFLNITVVNDLRTEEIEFDHLPEDVQDRLRLEADGAYDEWWEQQLADMQAASESGPRTGDED